MQVRVRSPARPSRVCRQLEQRVVACTRDGIGGSLVVYAVGDGMSTACALVEHVIAEHKQNATRTVHVVRLDGRSSAHGWTSVLLCLGLLLPTDRVCLQEMARQMQLHVDVDDDNDTATSSKVGASRKRLQCVCV